LPNLVVGICGGTGSGKTTLTNRLVPNLPQHSVVLLQQDHYYKNLSDLPLVARSARNFDRPDAIDTALMDEHVRALRCGEGIDRPVYDFTRHCRAPKVCTSSRGGQSSLVPATAARKTRKTAPN
jgi:uridine kinase